MVLTFKFLIPVEPRPQEIQYIVPIWMMLYGTGVYTAGLFSIRPPRSAGRDVHRGRRRGTAGVPALRDGVGGTLLRVAAHRVWAVHPAQAAAGVTAVSDSIKPDDIDHVIHERVRLAIVSALAVAPELSFNELKEMLSLTDGNLSAHARTLEEAGYIAVKKTFHGRRPLTTMRLSAKGRKAFQRYVDMLRQIIDRGDASRDSPSTQDPNGRFFCGYTL